MLWATLYNKIAKQPLQRTAHQHVFAILENPKTHKKERVNLLLKFDTNGDPYLIADERGHKNPKRRQHE